MATPSLLETLHNQLRMIADPGKARGMQAYMKSAIFYLGVSAVPLERCAEKSSGKPLTLQPNRGNGMCWQSGAEQISGKSVMPPSN